jgi:energy-coupling factor transporter ATP-binding protein EcfA2
MYVQEITLTNVRQFENESFRFQPGFNLLVGENGAGKTTLLRVLLAVLSRTNKANPHQVFTDDDIRLKSSGMLRIMTSMVDQNGVAISNPVYKRRLGSRASRAGASNDLVVIWYGSNEAACKHFANREVKRVSKETTTQPLAPEGWLSQQSAPKINTEKAGEKFGRSEEISALVRVILKNLSDKFIDFQWTFEPFGCSILLPGRKSDSFDSARGLRRKLESAILRHFQEVETPLRWVDREFVTIDPRGFVVGVTGEKPVLPPFRDLLERTQSDIREAAFLDECNAEVRLTPRIRVITKTGDSFLLSQLSDGEKRLFSLFVDITRQLSLKAPNPNGFKNIPAVILIDEIDVHLHPKWQRRIVPALEDLFPACQFIATPHSPFVIQAVDRHKILRPGKIERVSLDGGANSIEDIVEDIQGVDMPQRGRRAEELSQTAEHYFTLLRRKSVPAGELVEAEKAYRSASEPFTNDPALHALLKVEQMEARKP